MLNIDYDGTLDLQRYQNWKKKNERLYSNQLLFPNGYGISIVCNAYSYGVDEWEGSHPLCSERFKCVQRGEIERLPGPISFQSGLTYSSVTTESSSSIGGFTDTEGNGGSNGQLSGT